MKNSRLSKVEESALIAPPVSAIEALGRNLYYQFLHGLAGTQPAAEGNATDMARALVEKAKAGDVRALRLAVDVMQAAGNVPPQTPTVTVNNDNRGQVFISEVRTQIVHVIRAEGPAEPLQLARRLHLTQDIINSALVDSPWFSKEADGWHLTAKAMAEVCEPLRLG